jgi:hypothetical protein
MPGMKPTAWRVLKNGKDLGIIESNYSWASNYWRGRCTDEAKYRLVAV